MRASIRAICLMGCLMFGACVRAQTPASGAREGSSVFTVVVSNAETSEPLAGARVQLRGIGFLAGNGRTDERGRLSIAGLAPGGYFAAASKPGFLNKESHAVAVSAGDAPRELRIALTPAGAVTGRVLDQEGKPVEHARVGVVPAPVDIRSAIPAMTDAGGRFRISGLSPGVYRVRAESPETGPPEMRTDGTKEIHYAPTYYGETLRVAGSSRVRVRPGEDTGQIEIKLIASPMVSISGRAIGFPAVERQLGVVLRYIGEHLLEKTAGGWFDSSRQALVLRDGSFRFWRVDPGAYSLEAMDGGLRVYSQRLDVEVAARDIENVELQYAAPIAIDGRIEYLDEGALWGEYRGPPGKRPIMSDAGPGTTPPPTQLVLRLVEDGINDHPVYVNAKDGRFRIQDLRPGRYRVESGYSYAQSVRLGALVSGGECDRCASRNGWADAGCGVEFGVRERGRRGTGCEGAGCRDRGLPATGERRSVGLDVSRADSRRWKLLVFLGDAGEVSAGGGGSGRLSGEGGVGVGGIRRGGGVTGFVSEGRPEAGFAGGAEVIYQGSRRHHSRRSHSQFAVVRCLHSSVVSTK